MLDQRNNGAQPRPTVRAVVVSVPLAAMLAFPSAPAGAQTVEQLRDMSIDDLSQINVTSVSKSDLPLADAPASVYVISRDDILRSGATTLPEMLRLAPNLQVYQTSPGKWVVTARGLNGNLTAQNFSNKLLVLIDGRTVYTPLFSGVYWDMPDVLPDNVDRIEVISGPGATLWGANAVNGVINVITRNTSEVAGAYADVRAGPDRQTAGVRLAGHSGDNLSFGVHGRILHERADYLPTGPSAHDGWRRIGGGFRADWTASDADSVTLTGEAFDGHVDHPAATGESFSGRNLSLRWQRQLEGGQLEAQVFYDRIARDERVTGGAKFRTDTFDGEIQRSFTAGRHAIVIGAGARRVDYDITGSGSLYFVPASDSLFIADIFAQDRFALSPKLTVVAGLKLEHMPHAGNALMPELRVAWKPSPTALVWAAVSRAVRSPTPFDTDVQERVSIISVSGNPDFLPEKLTAFELGTRLQPTPALSFSGTLFYHRYQHLRSIELVNGPGIFALGWDNKLHGATYGVDAWADWRASGWLKFAAGATVIGQDLSFDLGSSMILGTEQAGNDPPYWLTLRSSMNLAPDVTFDLDLRAVGPLRKSAIPAYRELGGRFAWQVRPSVALSLTGTNLLHDRHLEYPGGDAIPRRVMGGVELRF